MDVYDVIEALTSRKYGFTMEQTRFLLRYTADDVRKPSKEWKVPNSDGFITLRYVDPSRFDLEDHTENSSRKGVAIRPVPEYNRKGNAKVPHPRRDSPMPTARGRRAAQVAPPEPEPEENGTIDFQRYLDKDLSPTMTDYVTWFEENVAALEDVPVDKLLSLGSAMYPHFQKSEFNITQREARRSERARPEPEPEPEPVKPTRGRPRKTAAAAPSAPEPAAAPARRGRGRPAKATAEAPY
jgi:hypothetical protein